MNPKYRETRVGESLASQGDKAAQVAADTGAGAALGAELGTAIPIPVIGNVAGAVIGTVAGAVYGAIDQFGPEVARALNPPRFSEDDYNRFRASCVASGGTPTPGTAPDNYGGCSYADGAVSGGDRPFPGTWNGEIRDPAAFQRHGGQITGGGGAAVPMCPGPFGLPLPCSAVPRPQSPQPPPNHIAPMPTVRPKPVVKAIRLQHATITVPHTVINAAHSLITSAKLGDAGAAQQIADTLAAARTGDPDAIHAAAVLSAADKIQIRAKYYALYILGRPPS